MLNAAWQQNDYALARRGGKDEHNWAQIVRIMATLAYYSIAAHNDGGCFEWSGETYPVTFRPTISITKL